MNLPRGYLALFCKGLAMGAADVVPGVSGGTIAFISGIYEQLLSALGSFNLTALQVLRKHGVGAAWRHVQGTFLMVLFSGVLLSIATFAHLFEYLLAHHPLLVWGFFFGLIAASVIYIWRKIPVRSVVCWLLLLAGAGLMLGIAFFPHIQIQPDPLYIFGAGMLAICAMILPGISGSFILLLLGMYPIILTAIVQLDMLIIALFGAGCVTGLLVFSRFLGWLLRRFHSLTLAVLTGFLVGSLVVVWPWQRLVVVAGEHSRHPVEQAQLFWPSTYAQAVGDPQWLFVFLAMLSGFALVLALERFAPDQQGQGDQL